MEILVASAIFMGVIIIAAASFAMVRRSNEKSDDSRVVTDCARNLEDVITSEVRSSTQGPRVMGVEAGLAGAMDAVDLTKLGSGDQKSFNKLIGIIVFPAGTKAHVIYRAKNFPSQNGEGIYYYAELTSGQISGGQIISLPSPQKILSDDCGTLMGSVYSTNQVFSVDAAKMASSSDSNNIVYTVGLTDFLYREGYYSDYFAAQASGAVARVSVSVTNSVNSL